MGFRTQSNVLDNNLGAVIRSTANRKIDHLNNQCRCRRTNNEGSTSLLGGNPDPCHHITLSL